MYALLYVFNSAVDSFLIFLFLAAIDKLIFLPHIFIFLVGIPVNIFGDGPFIFNAFASILG